MCSFPEMHKCEVHHLTFDSRFVLVDKIKQEDGGHKRAVANMRKLGVTRVLWNTNAVVYCTSKANTSATYDQTATSDIMSIVSQNTTYNTTEKGSKRRTYWDRYVHITKQSRRTAKNQI